MEEKKVSRHVSRELSLWALLARSSFYKILAVLGGMVLTEGFFFLTALRAPGGASLGEALQFWSEWGRDWLGWKVSLENIIDNSFVPIMFLAALGLVFWILVFTERNLCGKGSYTLMRLEISRKHLGTVMAIYNGLCLLMLFAVQVCIAFWMVHIYRESAIAEGPAPQLLFLTFYRNDFLHCLLPMAEVGKWVRNLLMILALSLEPVNSKGYYMVTALYVLTAFVFVSSVGINGFDLLLDLVCGVVVIVGILRLSGVIGRKWDDQ